MKVITVIFKHDKVDLGYGDLVAVTLPSGRKYIDPDGNEYPSITTVLGASGKESLQKWKDRVGEEAANAIGFRASNRGEAVHELIEKYLDNEALPKVMPHIMQSLNSLKPFLHRIGTIYAQECPLYSKHLGVAGRVDCVAEFDGKLSIIDFKTSLKPKKKEWISKYFMQETAYAIMWEERTGKPITQLVTIMDVDDNEPLLFIEHRDNWAKQLLQTIDDYKNPKPVVISTLDLEPLKEFNVRDVDAKILKERAEAEAIEIHSKDSTRKDRTLEEITLATMYGHVAEVWLLQNGFKDDIRKYKDLFEPDGTAIEVKVTQTDRYIPDVLNRCREAKLQTFRDYPDRVYVYVNDRQSPIYKLHGPFNWSGSEFI